MTVSVKQYEIFFTGIELLTRCFTGQEYFSIFLFRCRRFNDEHINQRLSIIRNSFCIDKPAGFVSLKPTRYDGIKYGQVFLGDYLPIELSSNFR